MSDAKKRTWKDDGKPRGRKLFVLLLGPLAVVVAGLVFYLFTGRYTSTDDAYIKADKTSITTEVSGRIAQVHVKDNTYVSAGDLLFEIDPEPFQIAVHKAEANLANVRADIESQRAEYHQKMADLAKAEAEVKYRELEYNRYHDLAERRAVSQEKSDETEYDLNTAREELAAAKQGVETLKAKLDGDPDLPMEQYSRYRQAQAELEKAQLDLKRVQLRAPCDGVAANVNMNPGEYTFAGLPLFTLVDEKNPWIEANFKETDLTHVRPGQDAVIKVDTYPGERWHAKVVSVSPATGAEFSILPAENSSGNWVKVVQRIMVRLELTDTDGKPPLRAGMSTIVKIDTGARRITRMFGKE